jgi:hypothetical protein
LEPGSGQVVVLVVVLIVLLIVVLGKVGEQVLGMVVEQV